jgi:hypothetical protein
VLYIRNATPQFLETVLAVQRTAEKQRFVIVSPMTFITGRCYIYKDVNNCQVFVITVYHFLNYDLFYTHYQIPVYVM